MKHSEEQKAAICHGTGPMMVLAGPGAGKTTVITHRVKYLIETEGVSPEKILVVTFSKAASAEMRERFEVITENRGYPVRFGTFHSLFFQVLSAAYHYEAKDIVTARLKYRFLEEALMETEYDDMEDRREFLEQVEREISRVKGEGMDIEHYYSAFCPEDVFRQIYKGYQSRVQKNRCLDFDDMVLYTYKLFCGRPEILARWQARFQYILIDEFQDINRLQYENLKLLAKPEDNLFIVGDDDQSIYGFRGARPDIMLSFPREYKQLRQVAIGNNYRCSSDILAAASALISHNTKRYQKKLTACRGQGDLVHVAQYADPLVQADAVAGEIRQYLESGIDVENIAVLFRTTRQMAVFTRKFMEHNIPFTMKDHVQNLFEHWVAADILTYLKIACGDYSRKNFMKIINRPKRYISRAAFSEGTVHFGALYGYYRDKPYVCERLRDLQGDLAALKTMTPFSAVDYIYHCIGYHDFLCEYGEERNMDPGDWEEVVSELREDASAYDTIGEWFLHIEMTAEELKRRQQGSRKADGQEPGVALMTMHGSKGLEFDVVFIPDVNDGIVPYRRAVEEGNVEEERRLLYVAMTRAKQHLHLSYVKKRFQKEAVMSEFIKEI